MTATGIILGFFSRREDAEEALSLLRRQGFSRSTIISKQPKKDPDQADDTQPPGQQPASDQPAEVEEKSPQLAARGAINKEKRPARTGIIVGGAGGMLLSSAGAVWQRAVGWPQLPGIMAGGTVLGAATGWAIEKGRTGVDEKTLQRFRKWTMRGETLVLVKAKSEQMARARQLLREASQRPATFAIRPARDLPQNGNGQAGATVAKAKPLRREAYTPERLREHAASVAQKHVKRLGAGKGRHLLERLRDNEKIIGEVCADLAEAVRLEQPVSLSSEWLIDNAYIIQSQVLDVQEYLSGRFYAELPTLTQGEQEGLPRVYAVASEIVAHTDGRLDHANLTAFLAAYQEHAPLSIGELWAMPLMLRLALIENLRRLVVLIDGRQRDRENADFWANRLLSAARRDPDQMLALLADLAQNHPNIGAHFADRLVNHLYDEESALAPIQSWLERKLNAPLAEIIQRDQRQQASDQISVSNAITSMRFLGRLDWQEVFEELSLVERVLCDDPAGVYPRMDFGTRNRYRNQIEHYAKYSGADEIQIARHAVELSHLAPANEAGKNGHVGFYLIDKGRRQLAEHVAYQPPPAQRVEDLVKEYPTPIYLGSLALTSTGVLAGFTSLARVCGARVSLPLRLLAMLPASELGVQVVNTLVTRLLEPVGLPRMDFEESGIPEECKTIVVVPMLLSSHEAIEEQIDRLEVHYLSSPDPNLRFALLSDWKDAPERTRPEDAELLSAAVHGIEQLNARYGSGSGFRVPGSEDQAPRPTTPTPFYLFHRHRQWCESENCWMGWERKRGKLEQLNSYLMGQRDVREEEMHPFAGDPAGLDNIRFVITLDADTQMPHGAARRMIETLAHPLNSAEVKGLRTEKNDVSSSVLSPQSSSLVTDGYAIIQPRVSPTLPSATATRFARIFSDTTGADPYSHVASDVYQDLFGEGSYHGKGIYDLRAFHRVLDGRFPDSTLLSHDLIEGAHVRVGIASDIELLDEVPPSYLAATKRDHRWIRGDWQIADWMTPTIPAPDGRVGNQLSVLNRWKIGDNLRRSLLKPATVGLLLGGWLGAPGAARLVSLAGGTVVLYPSLLHLINALTSKPLAIRSTLHEVKISLARDVMNAALWPHGAGVALDAIGRVLYRRFISKSMLLEWQTAQSNYATAAAQEAAFLTRLGLYSGATLALGATLLIKSPATLLAASPFLTAWASAPLLVRWLSGGRRRAVDKTLTSADKTMLRGVARQTWRYFDDFIGPQTNWLPPDNYQETLNVEIALRTSPTNIGLWFNALLVAHDFGYITTDEVVGRSLFTLETLEELPKHRGHLFNWYNVQTLDPLPPRYVSTVDSGNMMGSLMVTAHGVRDILEQPILRAQAFAGLADTVELLKNEFKPEASPRARELVTKLEELLREPPSRTPEMVKRLWEASDLAEQLAEALMTDAAQELPGPRSALDLQQATTDPRFAIPASAYWAAQIETQTRLWTHTINRYLEWVQPLAEPGEEFLLPLGEEGWRWRREALETPPTIEELSRGDVPAFNALMGLRARGGVPTEVIAWLDRVAEAFDRSRWLAGEEVAAAEEMMDRARALADGMEMRFLYDEERKLFAIGYSVDEARRDASYYDLLVSECRLASFLAIARGEVPAEHWWALTRRFGSVNGQPVLLSWSGTMFEYLMPPLFMHSFENSLLDETIKAAVQQQIAYGKRMGFPWGISESAFSDIDARGVYQYKAFGVPGLGLQRGHESDRVVAPYATLMALIVDPRAAIENLQRLEKLGARGDYGFYEAVDFGRKRLPGDDGTRPTTDQQGAIVRTFMVHHQGMALLALDNLLNGDIMRERFHADPYVRATTPLLYEKYPTAPPVIRKTLLETPEQELPLDAPVSTSPDDRVLTHDTPLPRVHLLSNGEYSVMITNAGGGYSRWHDLEITRWRADTTRDQWGSFIYLRDLDSRSAWSAAHQPLRRIARQSSVVFKSERAEFKRRDAEIETFTEIVVAPEDAAEIRRVNLVNHSTRERRIELTSYAEIALAEHNADRAHPAFSKLFIQTETAKIGEDQSLGLLAWRRPRSSEDEPVWAGHLLTATGGGGATSYETDRARFLGRNHTPDNPIALRGDLSETIGAVLDPIFSLRRELVLQPGERADVTFITAAGKSRDEVLSILEKYHDTAAVGRAFDLVWTNAQLEMSHLRMQREDAQVFDRLASSMLYPYVGLRAPASRLRANTKGQQDLWAYGISGDLPIMVVTIANARDMAVVRQALMAHTYWRMRGFKADLVILNQRSDGYQGELTDELRRLINSFAQYTGVDEPGGIFLRQSDQMPTEDVTLILAAARVVLVAARGSISRQLNAPVASPPHIPRLILAHRPPEEPSAPLPFMELPYFNGLGGFTDGGEEYAIYLGPDDHTPMPWSNVIANPNFGALLTEAGQGNSWYGNSQANRLTPWSNDSVSDPAGEAIYIRDEDTGTFWTPTPLPIRENDAYRCRHGQGYSVWEHNSHAIEQELTTWVPLNSGSEAAIPEPGTRNPEPESPPLRIQRLRLRNASSRPRRLMVTFYAEWVLGIDREEAPMQVTTNWDAESHTLLAQNHWNPNYGSRVAFATAAPEPVHFSADRTDFLGRNGTPEHPVALRRRHIADRCGAGLDPCAVLQVPLELEPGEETEIFFLLGEASCIDEVRSLVAQFRDPRRATTSLIQTRDWWDDFLSTLTVETPVKSVNFLLNRWLLYQNLSCRVWGRSAFYQSGGAWGFRDQLQDVMSLVYSLPHLAREQILRAARHQFEEGDVQHWWHEPSGAGVRTKISDDLLWLPLVVAHYIRVTGDAGVLDEVEPFLCAEELKEDEHEKYFVPDVSQETATIYEHCRRAIERGSTQGPHKLPLIGAGDWNDGLNRVGIEGKGESVWMAWFLAEVLNEFAPICETRGEQKLAQRYRKRAKDYATAVEKHAWDGQWYVRGFFDDGTPLGSHRNEEAKIDSLPQSWAVISGEAREDRAGEALGAVEEHLVETEEGMIRLFAPAYDKTEKDPGYIKGYLPGVRENGGQYTHAAIWVTMAFARRGNGDRAVELLRLINPVEHARNEADVEKYKVEPYVVAADVYWLEGQIGRGGWTWYTGSAGWMYRVWVEEVLGFRKQGERLFVDPVIPSNWPEFRLHYRHLSTLYHIHVENPNGENSGVTLVEVDGEVREDKAIPLYNDGGEHHVRVILGSILVLSESMVETKVEERIAALPAAVKKEVSALLPSSGDQNAALPAGENPPIAIKNATPMPKAQPDDA